MYRQVSTLVGTYIIADEYQQAIKSLNAYYNSTDVIVDTAFALEAKARTLLQNYSTAVDLFTKAIELSEKPQQDWNHSLYLLHVALLQDDEASKVLEKLRLINPNESKYWEKT